MVSIKEFLSTSEEWHALVIGWSEAIYPREPRFKIGLEIKNPVKDEYWYYSFGLALGALTWAGIVVGCIAWLLR